MHATRPSCFHNGSNRGLLREACLVPAPFRLPRERGATQQIKKVYAKFGLEKQERQNRFDWVGQDGGGTMPCKVECAPRNHYGTPRHNQAQGKLARIQDKVQQPIVGLFVRGICKRGNRRRVGVDCCLARPTNCRDRKVDKGKDCLGRGIAKRGRKSCCHKRAGDNLGGDHIGRDQLFRNVLEPPPTCKFRGLRRGAEPVGQACGENQNIEERECAHTQNIAHAGSERGKVWGAGICGTVPTDI